MTTITACPDCSHTMLLELGPGRFQPHECQSCGCRIVVEMTTLGGRTYLEDEFVDDILPEMDDIERIDHPTKNVYVYGDRDDITPKTV